MSRAIRNIAIIAHVDHGKTTLVDQLLRQSGTFREPAGRRTRHGLGGSRKGTRHHDPVQELRGRVRGTHINIVDTPGHADFGGEVERVLSMVDSVLLLVDAVEGPMPQTRFVTKQGAGAGPQADRRGQQDRPPGRASGLGDQPHLRPLRQARRHRRAARLPGDLRLGLNGFAVLENDEAHRHAPAVRGHPRARAAPEVDADGPLQMQICSLDYSTYMGRSASAASSAAA
jgi:GTP-binding protein